MDATVGKVKLILLINKYGRTEIDTDAVTFSVSVDFTVVHLLLCAIKSVSELLGGLAPLSSERLLIKTFYLKLIQFFFITSVSDNLSQFRVIALLSAGPFSPPALQLERRRRRCCRSCAEGELKDF